MPARGMVIVGAGEAGCRAAVALREKGYEGTVTLINGERHMPYERPPLSKGSPGRAATTIITEAELAALRIDHLSSTTAAAIDRSSREVALQDGRRVPYEKLLLATGASPRSLTGVAPHDRIMTVRTLDDADRFHGRIRPGIRVAMVGAGFIGLELAAVARQQDADVIVIEAQPRILMRGVPSCIGEVLAARHSEAGVVIETGSVILGIHAGDEAATIELAGSKAVKADLVVVGIGATPNTELAHACGLACHDGIQVDLNLQTGDANIFAAGDCCSFPAALFGDRRIRIESWRSAREQGEHAAIAMLGSREPFVNVPWFWSDQYELGLQVVGLTRNDGTSIVRTMNDGAVIVFQLAPDGTMVFAGGIARGTSIARDIKIAEAMIRNRVSPDPVCLADADIKLKTLLAPKVAMS